MLCIGKLGIAGSQVIRQIMKGHFLKKVDEMFFKKYFNIAKTLTQINIIIFRYIIYSLLISKNY